MASLYQKLLLQLLALALFTLSWSVSCVSGQSIGNPAPAPSPGFNGNFTGLSCPPDYDVSYGTGVSNGLTTVDFGCVLKPCVDNRCGPGNNCSATAGCQCNPPYATGSVYTPVGAYTTCYIKGGDVCNPNPCLNGGTCSYATYHGIPQQDAQGTNVGFLCGCPSNWTGSLCGIPQPNGYPKVIATVDGISGPLANGILASDNLCSPLSEFPVACLYNDLAHYVCCDAYSCGPIGADGNTALCRGQGYVPSPNDYPPNVVLGGGGAPSPAGPPSGNLSFPDFSNPPPGAFVIVWNAIPAKQTTTFPVFGGYPIKGPPYQYDWFNVNPSVCQGCVGLEFYIRNVFYVEPDGQRMQLTSTGGCDITTQKYNTSSDLINSCQGDFRVPGGGSVNVSSIWSLMQAPDGFEFQIPTPFGGFNCNAFTFPGAPINVKSFEAAFDTGPFPQYPPGYGNSLVQSLGVLGVDSLPFPSEGIITFKSINMRAQVDPPSPVSGCGYGLPYPNCLFQSTELTVRSASPTNPSTNPPASPSTNPPANPSTNPPANPSTNPPTNAPAPAPANPPACDPNSANPNQCFNAPGDASVCCPGECPDNPGPTPACKTPPATSPVAACNPDSTLPNQCFNADGSSYVCCPGQCPDDRGASPACA